MLQPRWVSRVSLQGFRRSSIIWKMFIVAISIAISTALVLSFRTWSKSFHSVSSLTSVQQPAAVKTLAVEMKREVSREIQHTNGMLSGDSISVPGTPLPVSRSQTAGSHATSITTTNSTGILIRLTVVACGTHAARAEVALKSAVMMSRTRLHLHVFSDSEDIKTRLARTMAAWPDVVSGRVTHSAHDLYYPPGEDRRAWKSLFRQCATVRLFLADVLLEADSTLYVDSDVVFFSPVEEAWALFGRFNSTQVASMTPEHEELSVGWYNRHGRHPYYGKTGLNSGVMLLNLTRLRHFRFDAGKKKDQPWSGSMVQIYHDYKNVIRWGDQDILNTFFNFNPGSLFVHSCEWNFRPDHCFYRPFASCPAAEKNSTIHLLHSNRNAAFSSRYNGPFFKVVYAMFSAHQATSVLHTNTEMVLSLTTGFRDVRVSHGKGCMSIEELLTTALSQGIARIQQ